MLGNGIKRVLDCETENRLKLRKFVVAKTHLSKGTKLSLDDFEVKRTGGVGIPANDAENLVGRILSQDIQQDKPIEEGCLENKVK